MPVICIGPVCIPWTAVLPIILWLGRPIWVRLPPAYQQAISQRWTELLKDLEAEFASMCARQSRGARGRGLGRLGELGQACGAPIPLAKHSQ